MPLTIALAGEESAGVQTLRLLAHRGHRVATVFTDCSEDEASASVASTARSLNVPVRAASDVRQSALAGWLREQQVDLLLSVHSRHIVHPDVLVVPAIGAYNLHPGSLPERAGMNPLNWALYEGADRHGVTLHHMTPVCDAGPIVFADSFDLRASDTGLSVLMQCVRRGLRLIEQFLELIEHGEPIPAYPQDLEHRRWFGPGPPNGGYLDWRRQAHRAVDFVRACDFTPFPSPWGFPKCSAHGLDVTVLGASVEPGPTHAAPGTVAHTDGAVLIAAADAWVRVEHVEVEDRQIPAVDVLEDGERLALLDTEIGTHSDISEPEDGHGH